MKIYLGIAIQGDKRTETIFRAPVEPTRATHGNLYNAVVGPFRTMRAARFMRDYGEGNPHCRCVEEAERLARL